MPDPDEIDYRYSYLPISENDDHHCFSPRTNVRYVSWLRHSEESHQILMRTFVLQDGARTPVVVPRTRARRLVSERPSVK